jgi:hypothetical protein
MKIFDEIEGLTESELKRDPFEILEDWLNNQGIDWENMDSEELIDFIMENY